MSSLHPIDIVEDPDPARWALIRFGKYRDFWVSDVPDDGLVELLAMDGIQAVQPSSIKPSQIIKLN